ncbi:MAG TPA: hypothetical protein VGE26_11390 [Sphingobacteriaceae bacterium]
MTIDEFKGLSRYDQEETVWWNGSRIAERAEHGLVYLLYSMGSFYVELIMSAAEEDESFIIKPFVCTRLLEPYLDHIALDKDTKGE